MDGSAPGQRGPACQRGARPPSARRLFGVAVRAVWLGTIVAGSLFAPAGCRKQGCLGGDDKTCVPASACARLDYQCSGGRVHVSRLAASSPRSPGAKAQAAIGDFVMENDRVRAVLDAPEHAQGLAPSGGSILDFAPLSPGGGDQLNGIFQGAGLLPRDAVRYRTSEIIDLSADARSPRVAVVFRGHLEGDADVTVVTRYELRPCEPGLRVHTELFNGASDPNTFALTDGFFWGDRTLLPFVPLPGQGFRHPDLDLLELAAAWRTWPFMAARAQATPLASYAVVPCDVGTSQGFNESTLSSAGVALRPTLSGDALAYERFIIAAPGPGLAPAVGEALSARAQLHGEAPPVAVSGRLTVAGGGFDGREGRAASLLVYEPGPAAPAANAAGDSPGTGRPWTEVVAGTDGTFRFLVPPNRAYHLRVFAFGQALGTAHEFSVAGADIQLGDVPIAPPARLSVAVTDGVAPVDFADVVVIPTGDPASSSGSLYGAFTGCSPMLGAPHGGSPACNRALTVGGVVDILVPPGAFFVYATRGPFASISRQMITLAPGEERALTLTSASLPGLVPAGVLGGDFHVHGAASFDSSIPDRDRVISFLSHGVDVIVATDHDVVSTYADAMAVLAIPPERLRIIPGVEATPNVLWFAVPGETFPKTAGHFNFWPLVADPSAPRNGAPWDELFEPGQLMDAMESLYASGGAAGVRQMNHPWSDDKLGRDQGFLRMIGYDPRTPIQARASFAADVLLRRPGGGHRNLDWDVQEVMTGADRAQWLRYRQLWFSLLSQGILKAGAANSDTHTLSVEQVGYPRNLVRTQQTLDAFDADAFDADVRGGHMVGTNGPVLDVSLQSVDGVPLRRPGLQPFSPAGGEVLVVEVRVAPWIPVQELRLIVNGAVARTISIADDVAGLDPFGNVAGLTTRRIPLAELLAGQSGDCWIVVEVGMPLPPHAIDPETGIPELNDPPAAPAPDHPLAHVEAIAPGVWPTAFSNPLLVDVNGGGWSAPGLSPFTGEH